MYAGRACSVVVEYVALLVPDPPKGVQRTLLVLRNPEPIHSADRVHDSVALVEERGVGRAVGRIEEAVVEEVVLVALVRLDALTPALPLQEQVSSSPNQHRLSLLYRSQA